MKIIFLDNDGVICLPNNWGSRFKKKDVENSVYSRFDNFDKKSIKVLNQIILETNADIVISSDWRRFATLDELALYYKSQGIIKFPIGVTSIFDHKKFVDEKIITDNYVIPSMLSLEIKRSLEIRKYLIDNPEITKYVVIDDLDMSVNACGKYVLTNFIHIQNTYEGIKKTGLKNKIINYF